MITPSYKSLAKIFPSLIGSEYLGSGILGGSMLDGIRHEDLTSLSFSSRSLDVVVTQDVFEHIPSYFASFCEIYRVLRPGGLLLFSIPFSSARATTQVRAYINSEGKIIHDHPPEIHGNPLSNKGALAFQNFGWDILDSLREANFSDAFASQYWGPWQGHLGIPYFIFVAEKMGSWKGLSIVRQNTIVNAPVVGVVSKSDV
jgi:SAM-dependent methyltransferase